MSQNQKDLQKLIEESVKTAVETSGLSFYKKNVSTSVDKKTSASKIETVKNLGKSLKEAFVAIPRSFLLKTDKLSPKTKEAHEAGYRKYIEVYNKTSSAIDSANKEEASDNGGAFRNLKENECYTLNAIKLHELYFTNISDLASEITVDAIPYIKLSRFYGTFERWQLDFVACCMVSRDGWAMTVFDPFNNSYTNVVVDGHTINIPVGCIPVIVIDMHSSAYFKDYASDKKSYVVNMMRELNWNVIEARMAVVEQSSISTLYKIAPIVHNEPNLMVSNSAVMAEPTPIQPVNHRDLQSQAPQQTQQQQIQQRPEPAAPTFTNNRA